ncbi:MAG TPA: ANTAR domain-containing protein [Acidimicrobiales bacterium]|nr:ANTAR domain-containing protein [Acidimicrobiales bacterium]
MVSKRLLEILDGFVLATAEGEAEALCSVARELLAMSGAGVLLRGDGNQLTLCATEAATARLHDLQFTLGEGPSVESAHAGVLVEEPDLVAVPQRWPLFAPKAVELGVGAIFSAPLGSSEGSFGSLTLWRSTSGALEEHQQVDLELITGVISRIVLEQHSSGRLAVGLISPHAALEDVVHQGAGMLSVQLDLPVADALLLLRAHAFASGKELREVAAEVLDGRLHLALLD